MGDALTNRILDHLPTFVIVIVVAVALLIVVTWWASKTWNRLKSLPCEEHKGSIERHSDRMEVMVSSLSKIEGQLEMLIRLMPTISRAETLLSDETPTFAKKNSPKALNANGEKVFNIFACRAFLDNNMDWLISEVEKFAPKTALDVEMSSLSALQVTSSDSRYNALKDEVYHSPAIELEMPNKESKGVEISWSDILFVLSIPLRDEYLARHPEIAK